MSAAEVVAQPQGPAPARAVRYGRKRAACLALVYVLMVVHVVHWKLSGRTLAPLELNEVMYTLELGVVTAGFLFMVLALVSVFFFGRFFCSWGCHILALQDLCAWLLGKVGIRPRPVRSRALLIVPPAALFYMFVWPQLARLAVRTWPSSERFLGARPEFRWRVLGDAEGWASFVTSDFWRNLPGPGITALTFLICGFAIVYFLGSRSFCTYGCPYGVVFGLADRVAPGRIVLKGECTKCGLCTAECTSDIRVHEEVARFGKVVSSRCLKDLDCVSACPTGGLGFGFARPAGLASIRSPKRSRRRYHFSRGEEFLMASVFVATVLVFRGLYSLVPFLLTLGLGGVLAFLAVVAVRLIRRPSVWLGRQTLKVSGRFTRQGRFFAAGLALLGVLVLHSGFIRYHEVEGTRVFGRIREAGRAPSGPPRALLEEALAHLRLQERWGLVRAPDLDQGLATLLVHLGRPEEAAENLRRIVARHPKEHASRLELARVLAVAGRSEEAIASLRQGVTLHPREPRLHNALGLFLERSGRQEEAAAEFRRAIALDPRYAEPRAHLGRILRGMGFRIEAEELLRRARELGGSVPAGEPPAQ